jgi:hypothetical protein
MRTRSIPADSLGPRDPMGYPYPDEFLAYIARPGNVPGSAPTQHVMPHLAEEPVDGNWDEAFAYMFEDPSYAR